MAADGRRSRVKRRLGRLSWHRRIGSALERRSLAEGVAFGGLSFLANSIVTIGSSIVVARVYGIHILGEFALAYAPTSALWTLSTVNEQPGLQRRLAELQPKAPRVTALFAAVFSFSFGLTAVMSGLACVAIYFVYRGPFGQPNLFAPAVVCIGGYLIFTNTCWNLDTILLTFRAGRDLFWLRLHQALIYPAVAVAATLVSTSVWGLVLALVASWFSVLLHRMVVVPRWITIRVSGQELRNAFRILPEIVKYGLKLTPSGLAHGASDEAGTWICGTLTSLSAVGAFNRASTLSRRFLDLNWRLTEMLFPTLVERRASGDWRGFHRGLSESVRYIVMLMFLPAAVGAGAAEGIMRLFGPGFDAGATVLALLLLVPAIGATVHALATAALAVDQLAAATAGYLVRLAVTLPAAVLLGLVLGISGVALGLVIGCLIQLLSQCWLTRKHLRRPLRTVLPLRHVAATGAAYAGGFVAARTAYATLGGIGGLVAALGLGCAAYVLCLVLGGAILPRDRERLAAAVLTRRVAPVAGRSAGGK